TQLYPEIQSSIVLPEGEEGREMVTEGAVTPPASATEENETMGASAAEAFFLIRVVSSHIAVTLSL
ncbi:MAG: hypothetical protein M3239_03150, partial [Thermoproteota archaeon]|nr:hypothetical protein [Thermoproteota archaeon]